MGNDAINWDEVPDIISKDLLYRLCHIGKAKAQYLLQNGLIPCEYTGKMTRCYKIKKEDVRTYLERRDQFPEDYSPPSRWYVCLRPPKTQEAPEEVAAEMRLLPAAGYRPYYLYRQKGTLQNLENIGWCKPGRECLYNVYIMEEAHTILAAGAGGSTKLVAPGARHGRIRRLYNCKFPHEYLARPEDAARTAEGVKAFYAQNTPAQTSGPL